MPSRARTALRRIIDAGRVAASDVVVLTPRSNRSSWLMGANPVEAWPYRLMPEYGHEGAVLPLPTKGNEVRVATIFRFKGLESPVVVLGRLTIGLPRTNWRRCSTWAPRGRARTWLSWQGSRSPHGWRRCGEILAASCSFGSAPTIRSTGWPPRSSMIVGIEKAWKRCAVDGLSSTLTLTTLRRPR